MAELSEFEMDYDYLIIASGTENEKFNSPGLDYSKDHEGRILIDEKLQVANFPGVYALGENAVNENNTVPFFAQLGDQ